MDNRKSIIDYADLPTYLGYQLRQAQSAVFRDFASIIAKTGVTPGEFSLLTLLANNPDISQVTLAAAYGLNKSTLSLAIKTLADRGLVERSRSSIDKRFFSISLTEEGRRKLEEVTRHVGAQERKMDSVLAPGERLQLLDMLTRITRVLKSG